MDYEIGPETMHLLKKPVTIYDIAKKLDVSASTVSRALKGGNGISPATRKRILSAAETMGYSTNSVASNLRRQNSKTVGVIVPKLNSVFLAEAIAGIENELSKAGYNLLISQSLESVKKEKENVKAMASHRVIGLLVSLAYDTDDINHFRQLMDNGTPVIFFDRVFENDHFPVITINNFRAAYELTSHLIAEGCRRIVHATGNQLQNVYKERSMGYKQALMEHGISFDPSLLIISNLTYEEGIEFGERLAAEGKRPDAIFAANDQFAAGCMQSIKKAGLSIPGDVAIAGFNDDPLCCLVEPHLTSVEYKGFSVGTEAAAKLVDVIKNGSRSAYKIVLKHRLIARSSTQKMDTLLLGRDEPFSSTLVQ